MTPNLMDPKAAAIAELNCRLRPPAELGGVFLPKGYPPQYDVMFIGEMPSLNEPKDAALIATNFNFDVTTRDRFFQDMLKKYGVAGSYVTDIVKARAAPGRPTGQAVSAWLDFLLKEVEIIDPKAIVVLGKARTYPIFSRFVRPRLSRSIIVDWVFHYSNQVQRQTFEGRFAEVISRIRQAVDLGP